MTRSRSRSSWIEPERLAFPFVVQASRWVSVSIPEILASPRSHGLHGNAVLAALRPLCPGRSLTEDDAERRGRHSHGDLSITHNSGGACFSPGGAASCSP